MNTCLNNNVDKSNIISIQKIQDEEGYYGMLMYDKLKDEIIFKNQYDEETSLTNKSRNWIPKRKNIINQNHECIKYKGNWIETSYSINDLVLHNKKMYISLINNNTTSINSSNWKQLTENIDIIRPMYYSIFLNGSCCHYYDENISKIDSSRCIYKHKNPNESDLYECRKIEIDGEDEIIVPLSYIKKCTKNYFRYNENTKNVIILKPGLYRLTYNIAYHGTIYDVNSMISTLDKLDPILLSMSNNVNYVKMHETVKNINHTFILPLKQETQLLLILKFMKHNHDKMIWIHPVRTWMSIEKIN